MKFLFADLWPWWFGGIAIGLLVPAMYYFLNTALGVSTSYGNLVKILRPNTRLKWLNSKDFENRFNWRFVFITGMVIGAFLSARVSGMPLGTVQMGIFTELANWPYAAFMLWFFLGGIFMGLGARFAGGCTSGHSIHGLATFQRSSLVATIFFILSGVVATYLIRQFIFGGV